MVKLITILFGTNLSFGALPPPPTFLCELGTKGVGHLFIELDEPIKMDGKVLKKFEVIYPTFDGCPDLSKVDKQASRNYKIETQNRSYFEYYYDSLCYLMTTKFLSIEVPIKLPKYSFTSIRSVIDLSTKLERPAAASNCEDR